MGIKSVEIQNFKSIKDSGKIELGNINVLVGANSAGKSNIIEFFKLLKKISDSQLQLYVGVNGGTDNILHFGRRKSDYLFGAISFNNDDQSEYKFKLICDNVDGLIFEEEAYSDKGSPVKNTTYAKKETLVLVNKDMFLSKYFNSFRVYHFNDTSFNSKIKTLSYLSDCRYLHEDGSNIASLLYRFKHQYPKDFEIFEYTIKSVSPFFNNLYLAPYELNEEMILLRFIENEMIFPASSLSDGILRFICLASILLFPEKPLTIFLDEPELGLHPFAIEKLGAMIEVASTDSQIIISTQSVDLINQFSADDIIVVKREDDETKFERQSEKDLENWLENYSIGEIWRSNIIGGTPL